MFRELNREADEQATKHTNESYLTPYDSTMPYIRAAFDGSCKGRRAAFGWVVWGSMCLVEDDVATWQVIATKSC